MHLTIVKEELLKGLSTAYRAIPSKSPNPVLTCFKLEMTGRGLEITASNGDTTIRTLVPLSLGNVEIIRNNSAGAILTNAHIITELVRKMDSAEIDIEVLDGYVAKISDDRSTYMLNCIEPDQYPDIELSEAPGAFDIATKSLTDLVKQTAFAAAIKSARPVLTAINLKAEGGTLTATTTDAARLSRKFVSIDPSVAFVANIPAKTMSDIVNMLEGYEKARMSYGREKLLLRFGNTTVASSLLSGEYPISDKVIPTTFNFHLEANASELVSAIERVAVLNPDGAPVVKLSMSPAGVEVSTRSDQSGSGVERLRTVQYTGQRLEITFNANFVNQAISALKGTDVLISFVGEMRPFVIRNPQDDSVVELVTPVRSR